jgi:hypothetical protein
VEGSADGPDDGSGDDAAADDDQQPQRRETREQRYRRERNEARTKVEQLRERVHDLQSREMARLGSQWLHDGADLALFGMLPSVLDKDDPVVEAKVKAACDELIAWKPGLARGARVPTPSFGQSDRGRPVGGRT